MFWLNKIVWMLVNPLGTALVSLLLAVVLLARGKSKAVVRGLVSFALVWIWGWCTPALTLLTGRTLEVDYPFVPMEQMPAADAIVCLGGGVGSSTNFCPYPLLNAGADRDYYAALLWKAGKAPIIIPSAVDCEFSQKRFMMDLGVPASAICVEGKARNTEENAKLVQRLLNERSREKAKVEDGGKAKVLLVTSAWHMKRSLLMFEKYAPELDVIPAAADHECLRGSGILYWGHFIPDYTCLELNCRYAHEWAGYFWYRFFRR